MPALLAALRAEVVRGGSSQGSLAALAQLDHAVERSHQLGHTPTLPPRVVLTASMSARRTRSNPHPVVLHASGVHVPFRGHTQRAGHRVVRNAPLPRRPPAADLLLGTSRDLLASTRNLLRAQCVRGAPTRFRPRDGPVTAPRGEIRRTGTRAPRPPPTDVVHPDRLGVFSWESHARSWIPRAVSPGEEPLVHRTGHYSSTILHDPK